MAYYLTVFVTLASTLLGMAFAIHAAVKGRHTERYNALYLLTRSAAFVLLAIVPLFWHSESLLIAVTSAMLLVQLIDGIIGIRLKSRMRTAGPFLLTVLHAACLLLLIS